MSALKAYGRTLAAASDLPDCLDPADVRDVQAALERARVVAVLDGWAETSPGCGWRMTDMGSTPTCTLYPTVRTAEARHFTASTPDAARAAAARAIEAGEV